MDTRTTAVIAIIVTAIAVTILSGFTATPEVITQLIHGTGALVVVGLVMLLVLWLPQIRVLALKQQRRIIWLAAVCGGLTFLVISFLVVGHHTLRF